MRMTRTDRAPRHERARGTAERLREDALAWRTGLEAARSRRPVVDIAFGLYERDRTTLGNLLAGSVAFRMFIWTVPYALLLVTLVSIATHDSSGRTSGPFAELALTREFTESLQQVAREGWTNQLWALSVGFVGAMWTSRGLMRALRISHAAIWRMGRVEAPARPVRTGLMTIGLVTLVLTSTAVAAHLREALHVFGLVVTFGMVVVLAAVWLLVSRALPHPDDAPLRALLPGAVLVGAGVQALHLVTVFMLVGHADRAESVYGAIGVAVVLLLWFFLLARLFVGAAVLNAVLWERERAQEIGLRVLGFRLFGRAPGRHDARVPPPAA
jgi:uncharacterized BrkB/YihY/UPF0761 family membrane protein